MQYDIPTEFPAVPGGSDDRSLCLPCTRRRCRTSEAEQVESVGRQGEIERITQPSEGKPIALPRKKNPVDLPSKNNPVDLTGSIQRAQNESTLQPLNPHGKVEQAGAKDQLLPIDRACESPDLPCPYFSISQTTTGHATCKQRSKAPLDEHHGLGTQVADEAK